MNISISVEILKRPADVFSWIEEPEKAMKWRHNVKAAEILKKTADVIGTEFKEIIEEGGKNLEVYGTITKFKKNRLKGFHLRSKLHKVAICYSIEKFKNVSKVLVEGQ